MTALPLNIAWLIGPLHKILQIEDVWFGTLRREKTRLLLTARSRLNARLFDHMPLVKRMNATDFHKIR